MLHPFCTRHLCGTPVSVMHMKPNTRVHLKGQPTYLGTVIAVHAEAADWLLIEWDEVDNDIAWNGWIRDVYLCKVTE
jgi:hypothetical protein